MSFNIKKYYYLHEHGQSEDGCGFFGKVKFSLIPARSHFLPGYWRYYSGNINSGQTKNYLAL